MIRKNSFGKGSVTMNVRMFLAVGLLAGIGLLCPSCGGRSGAKAKQPEESEKARHEPTVIEAPAEEAAEPAAPAFAFTLKDQDGKDVSLSDFAGEIVVLEWVNPDCPFVQRHYQAGTMKSLAEKYADKGVVWLSINSTNYINVEKNAQWVKERKLPYRVLDDHEGKVGRMFAAATTPHMFILDEAGELVYQGAIDDDIGGTKADRINYVQKALDELLAGKPVSQPKTKPYGCTVKYAK